MADVFRRDSAYGEPRLTRLLKRLVGDSIAEAAHENVVHRLKRSPVSVLNTCTLEASVAWSYDLLDDAEPHLHD